MPVKPDLIAHAATRTHGTLATIKRDGRPQLSIVGYALDQSGPTPVARISLTKDRAKTANLRRDPRASLAITEPDSSGYVVLEGDVELTPVAAERDDATVRELIEYYRALRGEHPRWEEYRAAMVADGRLVARLTVTHTYGWSR